MSLSTRVERMIAFAGEGVFSPVLESQVVVPLRHLGRLAPRMQRALLVLTSMRHRRSARLPERSAAIRAALPDIPVLFRFRIPLHVPAQRSFWAAHLRAAIDECGYTGPAPIIVHCRGPHTADAAAYVKRRDRRIRVLLDMRGDLMDEARRPGLWGKYLRHIVTTMMERATCGADGLNVVSTKLAEYMRTDGFLRRELPMSVVGCCVDLERFRYDAALRAQRRRELNLDGKFVVSYCGSMAPWQRPDAVAAAYAAIRAGMPDAHLLLICREAGVLLEHLGQWGIGTEQVTVRSASHTEVASYLMAGDVGLLLREDIRTNQVASPVKFAEYVRCGVPVILTPYIGDLGAFACREDVGQTVRFPVDAAEVLQAARAIRERHAAGGDEYRRHCTEVAARKLSWEGQIGEILRLYDAMVARDA